MSDNAFSTAGAMIRQQLNKENIVDVKTNVRTREEYKQSARIITESSIIQGILAWVDSELLNLLDNIDKAQTAEDMFTAKGEIRFGNKLRKKMQSVIVTGQLYELEDQAKIKSEEGNNE